MRLPLALALVIACGDGREPRATSGPPTITPSNGGWGSAADLAKLPGELWFVSERAPPRLVRIAGGQREEIADAIVPHARLPDGRLVGVRTVDRAQQIVLVGTTVTPIGPVAARIDRVLADPEGRWLVCELVDGEGTAIARIALPGGAVARLAPGRSPTLLGDRVAFVASGDLFAVPVTGGEPAALVRSQSTEDAPVASRDGVVLYTSDREGPRRLFVLHDGTERRLTERAELTRDEHSPAWSSDGRYVAYVVQRGTRRHVWIRDVDRRSEVDVTPEGIHDGEPVFSPDSRWVVVSRMRGHDVDLWAIPTGVGEPVRLTTGRFPDVGARWF